MVYITQKYQNILRFIYELKVENKLSFLDVLVKNGKTIIKTNIYIKNIDKGQCLNADINCATKYKTVSSQII